MKKYEDILRIPHHQSSKRPHMSRLNRAAQFAPFAALTGYDGAVKETARLTDRRVELDGDEQERLDEAFRWVIDHMADRPEVTIVYFVPDGRKAGGAYVSVKNWVKKYRDFERELLMGDGTVISLDEVVEIRI